MRSPVRIQVDLRSHVPIYTQLVERIQQLVATGALRPGDQLPTVRQLAADLRVNFNTVARAYRMLDEAGLISTQQGRGTYVQEAPPSRRARRLRKEALEGLTRSYLAEAAHMGFEPEEIEGEVERLLGAWREQRAPPARSESSGREARGG